VPRARSPSRDKAFELWKESNGEKLLKDIAAELKVKDNQVRKWKNQDKWDEQLKGNVTIPKRNVTKKEAAPIIKNEKLNDRHKEFCLQYLKYYNATKAYQKVYGCAYSTASVEGHRLLNTPKIASEIQRVKAERQNQLFLDGKEILQKYIDIALADITDFTTFGKKTGTEKYQSGTDEDGNPIFMEREYSYNYVEFKNHDEVDGTLITEVKQGKDGVSVKLADKMKALEVLTKFTDMLSDNDRKKLQDEKLRMEIEKTKAEVNKLENSSDSEKDVAAALRGLVNGVNSKAD
jgi:phage terminase small subunit